jgi:hypothetical protein
MLRHSRHIYLLTSVKVLGQNIIEALGMKVFLLRKT